jgi:hypothetical protein
MCSPSGRLQKAADYRRYTLPILRLGGKLLLPGARDAIESRAPVVIRRAPFRGDPTELVVNRSLCVFLCVSASLRQEDPAQLRGSEKRAGLGGTFFDAEARRRREKHGDGGGSLGNMPRAGRVAPLRAALLGSGLAEAVVLANEPAAYCTGSFTVLLMPMRAPL